MNKKTFWIVLLLVVLFFGYWMWSQNYPPTPLKVSATYATTGAAGVITFAIQELELDKKNGLELVIHDVEPGEAVRRLNAREVDIGGRSPIELAKTSEFKAFAPQLNALHGLLVRNESPYQTIEDLKGKKIAVLPKATAAFQSMDLELKILGFDLEKDFSLAFGGIPDTIAFLKKREVDAAFLPDPVAASLIASGEFRELVHLSDLWEEEFGVPYIFNSRVAYNDWLQNNAVAAKRFRAMSIEAAQYVKDHPEFIERYAREVLKIESEDEIKLIVQRLPKAFPTRWDKAVVDNAVLVMQKAAEFGFIEKVPDNPERLFEF